MNRYRLPLLLFVVLLVFLAIGLSNDPRYVPSPLIDKPAPTFSLPTLSNPKKIFTPAAMQGRVWLFNAWTSDCPACRQEHPYLLELARQNIIPIVGLNYRDSNQLARGILQQHGNPYEVVVTDHDGSVGIDYGVYAVPETFLIDKHGVIRFKHIGPLQDDIINNSLMPLIRKLQGEAA